jgi:hypothetical protein
VGFLEGIRGRRPRLPLYRTVDGGHPAPYPDMTDEQLYNYETTFNVARRTFSQPPPAAPARPSWAEPMFAESRFGESAGPTFAYAPLPKEAGVVPGPQARAPREADLPERERLRRNRAFDAPRYTARKASRPAAAATAADPALDFSKPVRTITTKQPVDIITTRARHPVYRVHAYIGDADVVSVFTLDGRLCENGPRFLENAPERRQLHLNIYLGAEGGERYRITQHETRQEADAAAEDGRLVCMEVKFEA